MRALRILLGSIGTALAHPRVLALAWLAVALPAALVVRDAAAVLDTSLSHHPGATFLLDGALDADVARLHPEARVELAGGLVFAILAGVFLGGGVLATVGLQRRCKLSTFLAEAGRLLVRNLRVLALGLVLAVLLFWGAGALLRWLCEDLLYESSPGRWLALGLEALRWLYGLMFVGLLFAAKVAMARLALDNRHSALLAWAWSLGRLLRAPFTATTVIVLWVVVFLLGSHAIGMGTAHFLEVRQDLAIGFAFAVLGTIWSQLLIIALWIAARRFVVATQAVRSIEPIVELPRQQALASRPARKSRV